MTAAAAMMNDGSGGEGDSVAKAKRAMVAAARVWAAAAGHAAGGGRAGGEGEDAN